MDDPRGPARIVGRYAMYDEIAAGGMATVHLGRLVGPAGFSRTVAIKRLHAQLSHDPEFVTMFLDEARVAARISHPNVVPVIDVVADDGELLLVMEYVHGESFSFVLRILSANKKRLPARIVGNVIAGVLTGLHAAHEATNESGQPLGIVHRDVSPQNVIVGADGVPRVLDFGVAKAVGQTHQTQQGQLKGKVRYMAPEQVRSGPVNRRADVWAASVMLWEALTGHKLFNGLNDAAVLMEVLERPIRSPRDVAPDVSEALARVCLRGLERDPARRYATALEMAKELEAAVGLVSPRDVGAWVRRVAQGRLEDRARRLAEIDADSLADSVAPVHASVPLGGATSSKIEAPMSARDIAAPPSGRETVTPMSSARPRPSRLRSFATAAALVGIGALAAFGARALGDRGLHLPSGLADVTRSTPAPVVPPPVPAASATPSAPEVAGGSEAVEAASAAPSATSSAAASATTSSARPGPARAPRRYAPAPSAAPARPSPARSGDAASVF